MSTISVIIITKNEAKSIRACLDSVKFADEIIVVDSGSTDETVSICQEYTNHIFVTDWPGYGVQKNRALAKCTKQWILSVDADEIVTEALKAQIIQVIAEKTLNKGYAIPRKSTYCNQFINHGDWKNDYCTRLFQRNFAHFKDLPIHEDLIVAGPIGKLAAHLLHHSFSSIEEVLEKLNAYSSLSAKLKNSQGKHGSLSKAIARGVWTFIRGYLLKRGFLDGKKGFMLAVSNAEGCYYRYIKMMLLNEKNSTKNKYYSDDA